MSRPVGELTADFYIAAHQRLVELAHELTQEQLLTPVPATPAWRVRDIYAHLAAVPTDAMAGRLTGIPDDEFTAGQVAEREDRTIGELVAEWSPLVGPMADGARVDLVPPPLAVDAITHEQDIRSALGLARAVQPEELSFCVDLYTKLAGRKLDRAELAPLRVRATDGGARQAGKNGEPAATVGAPEFELFRALSGRRSRRQVECFEWDGDAEPYVERFNVFGALPSVDIDD